MDPRTFTIALADDGRPDNVDRGNVLRRILHRDVRYARKSSTPNPASLAPYTVVIGLGDVFPEVIFFVSHALAIKFTKLTFLIFSHRFVLM
jgi:alanyl-tRNA synthetase